MRVIFLLIVIASLGACTAPRALSLEAAANGSGIIPPGVHRTETHNGPFVIEWGNAVDPGIYLVFEGHGEVADLAAWYDQHLPKRGWQGTWKPDNAARGVNRMQRSYERTEPLVREHLDLDAYPKPDTPGVYVLKITLTRDCAVDKPSQMLGVGLNWICFGWMGEYAIFFWPIHGAFCLVF